MYKDDMFDRMQRLDRRVSLEFKGDGRFQVVIVGGGMLVLRGYIVRSTDDIDILERLVKDEEELRSIKMSDRDYMNFEATYEEFERRFRPCEN